MGYMPQIEPNQSSRCTDSTRSRCLSGGTWDLREPSSLESRLSKRVAKPMTQWCVRFCFIDIGIVAQRELRFRNRRCGRRSARSSVVLWLENHVCWRR